MFSAFGSRSEIRIMITLGMFHSLEKKKYCNDFDKYRYQEHELTSSILTLNKKWSLKPKANDFSKIESTIIMDRIEYKDLGQTIVNFQNRPYRT